MRRGLLGTRARLIAFLLICLLAALTGVGAAAGLQAKAGADRLQADLTAELNSAASDLQAGKDLVSRANTENNPALLDQARTRFDSSRAHFLAAENRLDGDPLAQRARGLPRFGPSYVEPRFRAVAAVATMGVALTEAGRDAADADAELLKPSNNDVHGAERLIGLLNSAAPSIAKIKIDLQQAAAAAARVDVSVLPSGPRATFIKARDSIAGGLAGVQEFEQLTPVLLEILGANGPRSYLVEQINPAELRGAGGFVGSYSTLGFDHGKVSQGAGGNVYTIDAPGGKYPTPAASPAPGQLVQAFGHGLVFGDSNFSPDFPTAARAGMQQLERETGEKVDGVIAMDPWAVAALLEVTGPVSIGPPYNINVQASTFPEEVFQRLNTEAANVPNKKTFFPVVAEQLIGKLSSLGPDQWSKLATALNSSVAQRHLQVYFTNQPAEAEMARISWAGGVATPKAGQDLMAEVEANYGGNKANHWLDRSYNLDLGYQDGKLHYKLTITLVNKSPDGYEGGRHYSVYLRYFYPAAATDARITASGLVADRFTPEDPPPGLKMLDGWLQLAIPPFPSTRTVTVEYTTDARDLTSAGHEIYWWKQAGTPADPIKITYRTPGKTSNVSTDLGQDRRLVLAGDSIEVKPGVTGGARLPVIGA